MAGLMECPSTFYMIELFLSPMEYLTYSVLIFNALSGTNSNTVKFVYKSVFMRVFAGIFIFIVLSFLIMFTKCRLFVHLNCTFVLSHCICVLKENSIFRHKYAKRSVCMLAVLNYPVRKLTRSFKNLL